MRGSRPIGSIVTAAAMGLWGNVFSNQTVFLVTVALCVPALIAIAIIRGDEIDAGTRARRQASAASGRRRSRSFAAAPAMDRW